MAFPRIAHTSFVLNGKVYVAGGIDGKAGPIADSCFSTKTHAFQPKHTTSFHQVPLETFECFDPSTKTWSAPMRLGQLLPWTSAEVP